MLHASNGGAPTLVLDRLCHVSELRLSTRPRQAGEPGWHAEPTIYLAALLIRYVPGRRDFIYLTTSLFTPLSSLLYPHDTPNFLQTTAPTPPTQPLPVETGHVVSCRYLAAQVSTTEATAQCQHLSRTKLLNSDRFQTRRRHTYRSEGERGEKARVLSWYCDLGNRSAVGYLTFRGQLIGSRCSPQDAIRGETMIRPHKQNCWTQFDEGGLSDMVGQSIPALPPPHKCPDGRLPSVSVSYQVLKLPL
ncbi:unnamed protein product [Protopolystoma xenopodis]|uniref:Uncharacterized protein n=1 Tax=Protopolystoma xenopodis TaxID=117903 RepID=A0A448XLP3_9PLAT|nr:unnamed protein product [Protopolystoma xenopodis]